MSNRILKYMYGALLPVILLYGCGKSDTSKVNVFSVIMSNAKVSSRTDTGCILKARYFINSYNFNKNLLDTPYFRLLPTYDVMTLPNGNTIFYTIDELSRQKISPPRKEFSLLFLMDKSLQSITPQFNNDHLKGFERAFNTYFGKKDGYEINNAVFANDNSGIASFRFLSPDFRPNLSAFPFDSVAYMFDITTNRGTPNMLYALDTALNFMNQHATKENKYILVFTDHLSEIKDTAALTRIANKANANNVHICIYSTLYPDRYAYGHLTLCNRTGGFYFSILTSKIFYNSFNLTLPALYTLFGGGDYYESTIKITADSNQFGLLKWAILTINFESYDASVKSEQLLYENR